jgi:hypothetical protein
MREAQSLVAANQRMLRRYPSKMLSSNKIWYIYTAHSITVDSVNDSSLHRERLQAMEPFQNELDIP